jgi:hypothetical protein
MTVIVPRWHINVTVGERSDDWRHELKARRSDCHDRGYNIYVKENSDFDCRSARLIQICSQEKSSPRQSREKRIEYQSYSFEPIRKHASTTSTFVILIIIRSTLYSLCQTTSTDYSLPSKIRLPRLQSIATTAVTTDRCLCKTQSLTVGRSSRPLFRSQLECLDAFPTTDRHNHTCLPRNSS